MIKEKSKPWRRDKYYKGNAKMGFDTATNHAERKGRTHSKL